MRYNSAAAVRHDFHHWNMYDRGWFRRYPGAWYVPIWAPGAVWMAASWSELGAWMDYYPTEPIYYDYGDNVNYQDGNVYVNGQDVGTEQQYYQQACDLATTGTETQAPADGQWLPLGVFALTQANRSNSSLTVQIAVNKEGIIRGNYTDTLTNTTQQIHGSVDKKTQQVAFTVGDNTTTVLETGLYNLTKDEAPCVIHIGADQTEQWLLVRLQKPDAAATDQSN